jgi:hypothetical protein
MSQCNMQLQRLFIWNDRSLVGACLSFFKKPSPVGVRQATTHNPIHLPLPNSEASFHPNRSIICLTMMKRRTALILLLALSTPTSLAAQIEPEPAGYVDCPLCANETHIPQDAFSIFTSGDNTLTCQTAFDLGTLRLPEENCTFWQNRGDTICQCAAEPATPNDCTLCEDGGALPAPRKEGAPGRLCAQLQIDAKRDFAEHCIVWQQTVGVYCGCENPLATSAESEVCHMCGPETDLPDPVSIVPLLTDGNEETSTSCGELEFASNLPGASCLQFQVLYGGGACCTNAVPNDSNGDGSDDDDVAPGNPVVLSWTAMYLVLLSLFHV